MLVTRRSDDMETNLKIVEQKVRPFDHYVTTPWPFGSHGQHLFWPRTTSLSVSDLVLPSPPPIGIEYV